VRIVDRLDAGKRAQVGADLVASAAVERRRVTPQPSEFGRVSTHAPLGGDARRRSSSRRATTACCAWRCTPTAGSSARTITDSSVLDEQAPHTVRAKSAITCEVSWKFQRMRHEKFRPVSERDSRQRVLGSRIDRPCGRLSIHGGSLLRATRIAKPPASGTRRFGGDRPSQCDDSRPSGSCASGRHIERTSASASPGLRRAANRGGRQDG
jgi:hypothetical protein